MDEETPQDSQATENSEDDLVIANALRRSLIVFACAAGVVLVMILLINREEPEEIVEQKEVVLPQVRADSPAEPPQIRFENVTQAAGIDFVHVNGAQGQKLLPETMGGGCAFFDHDNDGDQDLLLVNSANWPPEEKVDVEQPPLVVLYENDGKGDFTDITSKTGLTATGYGMGVAVGDYDNDGDRDLYITTVGANLLLRNDGGTYTDVTSEAGVAGSAERWSTSCGWLDYDNDGDLDLLVGNYVEWSPEIDLAQDFRLTGIGRAYGPPFSFGGTFPYLYRNEGNGKFTEVAEQAGLHVKSVSGDSPLAKTLGVAPIDVNADGWIDFVLANDTVRNLLFVNRQDGTFEERGIEVGVAFDASGKARGAMGIDAACFRNDDCLGIAISNFANEMTALYVSENRGELFTDDAVPSGLGPPTRIDLSFGLFFFDVDCDGRLDLFTANGHLENEINVVQVSQKYQQIPRLFWNTGGQGSAEFVGITLKDSALADPLVGRGAAYADIDADGDLDVLVTQIAGPPALLRNELSEENHFLRLKLVGKESNHDAIGAWIEVTAGKQVYKRQVMPTRSYLSQVELPVTIGLGKNRQVDRVEVVWPGGERQKVRDVKVDGTTDVVQSAP